MGTLHLQVIMFNNVRGTVILIRDVYLCLWVVVRVAESPRNPSGLPIL